MLLRRLVAPRAVGNAVSRRASSWTTTTTTRTTTRLLSTASPQGGGTEAPEEEEPTTTNATATTNAESFKFQAETKSLLRIVSNALYTEREIFLRELVSNACDALEKARQKAVGGEALVGGDVPLEVRVAVDKEKGELTIADTGIGMTRAELAENLGTIALSGSRRFAEAAAAAQKQGTTQTQTTDQTASAIIGQFGVGFYSAFMVGDRVTVESRSALSRAEPPCRWSSEDGAETFELSELVEESEAGASRQRGSIVRVRLKADATEFLDEGRLVEIVKKHSNFAPFPVYVNETRANAVEALWARDPKSVEDDEYDKFYRSAFKGAWDSPTYWLHFRADAPLEIKALLYFPGWHNEKAGMGRTEPGVSLYCRKVLIESPARDLLPDWLRFVKGVVDSEDLPLSISREKAQDRSLLEKIKDVLVRKVLRLLKDNAAKERDRYLNDFYKEFQVFLKEGVCNDRKFRDDIAKLLYFDSSRNHVESNNSSSSGLTSFDEYASRLPSDATDDGKIYYLYAPSRSAALSSPYFEPFKKTKRECLFVYNPIDDFVMSNVGRVNDRQLAPAESYSPVAPSEAESEDGDDDTESSSSKKPQADDSTTSSSKFKKLDAAAVSRLAAFVTDALPGRVSSLEATSKLDESPAVVVDAESGAMRRMMAIVSQQNTGADLPPLPPQKLQINPKHPVVTGLSSLIADLDDHSKAANSNDDNSSDDDDAYDRKKLLATTAAHQLLDNALVAAGLMDDSRSMLSRLNLLLEAALHGGDTLPRPKPTSPPAHTAGASDDPPAAPDSSSDQGGETTMEDDNNPKPAAASSGGPGTTSSS